ncbi:MAG: proteasome subunit beta [Candidatus Lokiarchaeota archaeon]|nr:proteasome subunit beta [Candidatus Lokiarchaeota archaeon]
MNPAGASRSKAHVLRTGTTTLGMVVKDAVILASDKRATEGFFIASKTADKIHAVSKSVAMTIAGSVADAQYLIDLITAEARLYELQTGKRPPVNTVVKILANELYRSKYPYPYEVQHVVGGVDNEGSKLYDVGGDGSILKETYTSTGSGSRFAYGVLEDGYKEGLSIEEGVDLAKKAVMAAISRDVFTGNGVDVFIITSDGIEKKSFGTRN